MSSERGSNDNRGRKRKSIVVALSLVVVTATLAGLFMSASVSPTGASFPGLPIVLWGHVTYADGNPAQNVNVSVENVVSVSGESLSEMTNEDGAWSIEASGIAGYGDEVLIYARDAWNNEVSRAVNISSGSQEEDLKFEVPMPTATPSPSPSSQPSDGDGSSDGGGTSGGSTFTPTPTPTPSPEVTPTVSPATATATPTTSPSTPSPVLTSTPSPGPTTSKPRILIPGFEAVFAISGLLAVAYAYSLMRIRKV